MQELNFHQIPQDLENNKSRIQNAILKKIYSQFKFLYFHGQNAKEISNGNLLEDMIFNFLKCFKFLTFNFTNMKMAQQTSVNKNFTNNILMPIEKIDAVICAEGSCILLEQINYSMISKIFTKLKEQKVSIIATNNENTKQENEIKEEISSFVLHFCNEIKINIFVNITIESISGFLIRRYFYPSKYFNNSSFFIFDKQRTIIESNIKTNIFNLILSNNSKEIKKNIIKLSDSINTFKNINNNNNCHKLKEFKEDDFINLRVIGTSRNASFHLAIHLESLYILALKKFIISSKTKNEIDREIYFCENFSHRCLTKCYGFLKNDTNNIIGIVYEYMSNGSLSEFCINHREKIDYIQYLTFINRIFQGIDYLHSNSLIHRDLKPLNILIDHDFLPFISDFETIRHTLNQQEKTTDEIMTNDIGSPLYTSPEQDQGKILSYSTDIYSFGLIIFYLFENKDIKFFNHEKKNITKCSSNIQNLYSKCVQNLPENRPNNDEIRKIIINEINSFYYFEPYLNENEMKMKKSQILQLFLENIIIQIKLKKKMKELSENIIDFRFIFYSKIDKNSLKSSNMKYLYYNFHRKIEKDDSKKIFEITIQNQLPLSLLFLGKIYGNGYGVRKDFLKSKMIYEFLFKINSCDALIALGDLYYNNKDIENNYEQAIKYYESAANLGNSEAFKKLGDVYYVGSGVEEDILKAIKYYELAANLNNPEAFNLLGDIYYFNSGVEEDIPKAIKYYESAAKLNNCEALNRLGNIYYSGDYVDEDIPKAIKYYESAAKLNNCEALNKLGDIYYYDENIEKDISKAIKYYESAAKLNNCTALNKLGDIYYDDENIEKDISKAIKYYESAAKFNSRKALNKLGDIYLEGNEVKVNIPKAIKYYKSAAKLNDHEALNKLGDIYLEGNEIEEDIPKAIKYYESAAKLNNCEALNKLGDIYYSGEYIKEDVPKAIKYYELAAKHNSFDAFNALGDIYYSGEYIEKDISKAIKYYESAAKLNSCHAFNCLGDIYFYGKYNGKNIPKAIKYYENAAQFNNSEALNKLGFIYDNGYYVQKDYLKAIKYYQKAAKLNNANALFNLGFLYENGFGVQKDYLIAKKYYELAAEQNETHSITRIGLLYEYGLGVEKNYSMARKYYEMAARFKDHLALTRLGDIYENGYDIPRDYLKAKRYYELAAEQDYAIAYYCLGLLYENGHGVEKDYSMAKKYYEISAQKNNSHAYYKLGLFYENGYGVEKDFLKAKKYYEFASSCDNSFAQLKLASFYLKGYGVDKNILSAKYYFEMASQQNNPDAFFYLGCLYSSGVYIEIDNEKSIQNYLKCIEIKNEDKIVYNKIGNLYQLMHIKNNFLYHSHNNLGLIFLLVNKDIDNAINHIKEAAFAEYPFAQNNFGLLNQFYLCQFANAEYMYEKASKSKFALAEYNFGYLLEKNDKIEKSIEYYIKASEHENEPLIFRNLYYDDKQLEICKTFIICFTNLKLTVFYFLNSNFNESKKYFSKSLSKINNENHQFKFKFQNNSINSSFLYLKDFILNYPLFNLENQSNLNLNLNFYDPNNEDEAVQNHLKLSKLNIVFNDPGEFFDFIMEISELKIAFIENIKQVIQLIEEILYTPPYPFLFGRINIKKKTKVLTNHLIKNVNEQFYDGFGFD